MKKILFGILYWLIQLTWGLLMTAIGFIVIAFVWFFDKNSKAHRNGYSLIIETGGNWGGLELGAFALCGHYSETDPAWFEHTRYHEAGHGFQNLWWGPLMPFVICIPSAIRYWYRRLTPDKQHPDYDDFWAEGQATRLGTKYVPLIEKK